MDGLDARRIILHGIVAHPVATIVPLLSWIDTPIVMPGQERLVTLALAFEGLQFGSHIHLTIAVIADIKGNNTNGIAGNQELIALLVVKHKSENTTQVFQEVDALFTIQRQYHFAVGARLELVLSSIAATNFLMVIDFTIHG